MLDGRIDVQGTVKELRDQGILENLVVESAAQLHKEDQQVPAHDKEAKDPTLASDAKHVTRNPRKLVKDEERETGNVKWSVYMTYLKASWVCSWISLSRF